MKGYLEDLIVQVGENSSEEVIQATKKAKEILESELFIEQRGIRPLVDKDARVGHKSRNDLFYGYKAEVCQTTDGNLITSVTVDSGAYVDGLNLKNHLEETLQSGLTLTGVYGDKAYFRPDILSMIKEKGALAYIPVSGSSYKIDEELLSYNKDSDQWFCVMGNETIKVKTATRMRHGKRVKLLEYSFEREKCRSCSRRAECMGKSKQIGKLLSISINTPVLYGYSQIAVFVKPKVVHCFS